MTSIIVENSQLVKPGPDHDKDRLKMKFVEWSRLENVGTSYYYNVYHRCALDINP